MYMFQQGDSVELTEMSQLCFRLNSAFSLVSSSTTKTMSEKELNGGFQVKMAGDMVVRGSLTCGLNPLFQNHCGTSQPLVSFHSQSVGVHDIGIPEVLTVGSENGENHDVDIRNKANHDGMLDRITSLQSRHLGDGVSCGSDISWDMYGASVTK